METYSIARFASVLLAGDGPGGLLRPGAGGTITVNLTSLTAQEQGMARAALAEWSSITSLRFVQTAGPAQITYSHAGTGAHTMTTHSGGAITRAEVEIGASRVAAGDTVGSYVFRTYMHETGHALGLSHPQDYGSIKQFAQSAIANDSWQMSLMSYFDQIENIALNASKAYNITPMVADYAAIRMAYGATSVRAGDTVYGVGSTAGGTLDRAAALGARAAFLIADTGGHDSLRFTGFAAAQRIDLRAGAISDVMGGTGNMQIAPDAMIEDASGGRGNDVLTGNAGANRLDGGGGSDVLIGSAGNDSYVLDGGDRVVERAGGGTDLAISAANWAMAPGVEHLLLTGAARIGTGNELANRITGTAGADTLDGRGGADTLVGGAGNDTYVLGPGDILVEVAGGGIDTVRSSADHRLAAGFENLVLTGGARVATGDAAANQLTGTAGANILDGQRGADVMAGGAGNDLYIADAGDRIIEMAGGGIDTVRSAVSHALAAQVENLQLYGTAIAATGNAMANALTGNALANRLDGLGGADVMAGGAGNDLYAVGAGDRVIEVAGGGTDTVIASVDYRLAAQIEVLRLSGMATTGLGNDNANLIYGTDRANRLDGLGGADTLVGGGGDDQYTADAADRIIEAAGGGTDTVRTAAASLFRLGANVENLILTGASGGSAIGNALANRLTGTARADRLDGSGGADTLAGGAGNDVYIADAADRLVEAAGGGIDTVYSITSHILAANLENLVLTGAAAAAGTGNESANTLRSGAGADRLDGRGGNDLLTGGGGADVFVFSAGLDRVSDFTHDLDTLAIRASDMGGITIDQLLAKASQTASGVTLDLHGWQLTLDGARLGELRDDLILS